jgi:hypothetical protein
LAFDAKSAFGFMAFREAARAPILGSLVAVPWYWRESANKPGGTGNDVGFPGGSGDGGGNGVNGGHGANSHIITTTTQVRSQFFLSLPPLVNSVPTDALPFVELLLGIVYAVLAILVKLQIVTGIRQRSAVEMAPSEPVQVETLA